MRMLLFFDLPSLTLEDKRHYRRFVRTLEKNGFVRMQESVFTKMMTSPSVQNSVENLIEKSKPPKGLVQTIIVTEKQFTKMKFIVGESHSDIIDTADTLVIL